jgi:hypothetical protein
MVTDILFAALHIEIFGKPYAREWPPPIAKWTLPEIPKLGHSQGALLVTIVWATNPIVWAANPIVWDTLSTWLPASTVYLYSKA